MRRTRVIPVLLIHNRGVYKTTKFSSPVYVGDPINAIRLFNDLEVDEIVVLDIDASKEGRGPDFALIEELAGEAFMPFSYGGGITHVAQAKDVLKCGIEKIIINNGMWANPGLLLECAQKFGSQSVVASIDFRKGMWGTARRFDHVTGKLVKQEILDCLKIAEQFGAGEILLNAVALDGSMLGMDNNVLKEVADNATVPVVICGGASSIDDMRQAEANGASGIAAGSMFVFYGKQKGVLISYPREQDMREHLL
ncbi:AglZ/HisF2 family acetamidino modification protein [Litorivicinus sp.]|nr:AglZ/HisF2 family acetamidino modification protein [Litorivicinus sp.]MDC1239994.1 AglZ/HisF2 family acetamidino modification protein [Litorivicinus sp.]